VVVPLPWKAGLERVRNACTGCTSTSFVHLVKDSQSCVNIASFMFSQACRSFFDNGHKASTVSVLSQSSSAFLVCAHRPFTLVFKAHRREVATVVLHHFDTQGIRPYALCVNQGSTALLEASAERSTIFYLPQKADVVQKRTPGSCNPRTRCRPVRVPVHAWAIVRAAEDLGECSG
jgi:hypothetical protein